jgi:hypothetical protein
VPGAFYQPLPGSTSCLECPQNTEHAFGSRGVNVTGCICKPGFWTPSGEAGVACASCPLGAVCKGGLHLPTTKAGFWVDRHEVNGSIKGFPFSNHSSLPQVAAPYRHLT